VIVLTVQTFEPFYHRLQQVKHWPAFGKDVLLLFQRNFSPAKEVTRVALKLITRFLPMLLYDIKET
jgi:hypothetical protein